MPVILTEGKDLQVTIRSFEVLHFVQDDDVRMTSFTQRDFVEKLASLVPPPWFNLTRYYGVCASAHVWREFIVPMGKREKRLCPAHDEPPGGTPPPPTKLFTLHPSISKIIWCSDF